jgi:hypothetical protein
MKYATVFGWMPLILVFLLAGCSKSTVSGSWKNREYLQPINKVYIVGVSKRDTHRRIFEDEFGDHLSTYGIQSVSSYKDLKSTEEADLETLISKVNSHNADALLLTRIIDKRIREVVYPGYVSGYYAYPPYYGYRWYYPRPYYYHYRDFYGHRYDMIYEPATVSRYKIITLESNLYDAATGELIWSAQVETVIDGKIQSLIEDFIEVVTKDLVSQGVI